MILRAQHRPYVSYSEIATFKTCRMRWMFAYHMKLRPRIDKRVMRFGSLAHLGMSAFLLGGDWKAAVDKETEKHKLDKFDEEKEDIDRLNTEVTDVLSRYFSLHGKDYKVAKHEGVPLVEFEFAIPIRGLKTLLVLRVDAVLKDEGTGWWLAEHKFPAAQLRPVEDIELSTQIGIYHYAAARFGIPVVGVLYNQILAKIPAAPSLNKDGSMSRAAINTDWATYEKHLVLCGLDPDDYQDMRSKLADKEFVRQTKVFRPDEQVAEFQEELVAVTYALIAPKKHIYMTDTAINCRSCQFRELCMERMRGRDPQHIIDEMFVIKQDPDNHAVASPNVEDVL